MMKHHCIPWHKCRGYFAAIGIVTNNLAFTYLPVTTPAKAKSQLPAEGRYYSRQITALLEKSLEACIKCDQ